MGGAAPFATFGRGRDVSMLRDVPGRSCPEEQPVRSRAGEGKGIAGHENEPVAAVSRRDAAHRHLPGNHFDIDDAVRQFPSVAKGDMHFVPHRHVSQAAKMGVPVGRHHLDDIPLGE
jgi:hypothetical protein